MKLKEQIMRDEQERKRSAKVAAASLSAPMSKQATEAFARVTKEAEASSRAKGRDGKKAVVGYFDPNVSDAIRTLAIRNRTTVEKLVGVGLNRVLAENGQQTFPELEAE